MALTLNNFIGFETGDLIEATSVGGTPDIQTTTVKSGTYSLRGVSGDNFRIGAFDIIADQGDHQIVGFSFRRAGNPSSSSTFFSAREGVANVIWDLQMDSNGDLRIRDANGTTIDTVSGNPLPIDVWNYIEVRWEHLASGRMRVTVNGVEVSLETTRDFTDGGTFDIYVTGSFSGAIDIFFDDIYCMSGSTADSDILGESEVFKYQNITNSATPDVSALADDVLDAGTWHRAGETPLASTATNPEYTGAGTGVVYTDGDGFPQGPNNDARIDGDSNIKAIKAISSMQRAGGGATDHFINFGNDGGAASDLTQSADLNPPQSFDEYFAISEASAIVPTASEHCAIGFETTGNQDYECREQWAMLLHVPTAPVLTALSQADFPDRNYYVGPYEI